MMVDVGYISGCYITSGSGITLTLYHITIGVMLTRTLFDPSKKTLSQCYLWQTFLPLEQMTHGTDPS